MPEEDEVQQQPDEPDAEQSDASVDDLAGAIARQLATYKEEEAMLAEEHEKIKARRAWLKVEITKAERMTRSLIPRNMRSKTPAEINPPVQQADPAVAAAPSFKPE